MKKLYKISFCLVSVLIIVFSMCPLSAFAITNPIYTSVSYNKPELKGNDFFVELLLYNPSTNVYHSKVVYVNYVVESDYSDVTRPFNVYVELRLTNDKLEILTDADNLQYSFFGVEIYDNNKAPLYFSQIVTSTGSYQHNRTNTDYGSGFQCINAHVYGDVSVISNRLTVPSGAITEFIVEYGESASIHNSLISILQVATNLYGTSQNTYARVGQLVDLLNGIQNQNATQINKLIDLVDYVRIMAADLILIRDDLQAQYDELIEQGQTLDDINSELYAVNQKLQLVYQEIIIIKSSVQEIETYVVLTYFEVTEIKDYVSQILEILNAGSDKDQPTTQDPTQLDNYYDAENSLVGNGAADVTGAVQVEINNNAMSVIWNIVQKFLDSHGKVIGFVLTILSFGLVALILGR